MKSDALLEATMLALQGKLLKESNPSNLKKSKNKDKKVHYEPLEGDYEHTAFDYELAGGEYEGSISDKKGNSYKVIASHQEQDTGSIAGGTTYFYVTILYNDHKINLKDHRAIFSRNRGPAEKLLTDIEDGIYLEDYLQKHLNYIDNISNIDDWIKMKKDKGESLYSFEYIREWVKENIINENDDYDERTSLQKKIDKKNESTYVLLDSYVPISIENDTIKLGANYMAKKEVYKGIKDLKYTRLDDNILLNKDMVLLLPEKAKNRILELAVTNNKYSFEITLDDLSNVVLLLDDVNCVFQINKNNLKPVYKLSGSDESIIVRYDPTMKQNASDNKLNELIAKANIKLKDKVSLPRLYKEIQSRLTGTEGCTVTIVRDRYELRARGDDGIHGEAWVQFPKDLRQYGKVYKVDKLIWNGKNYRAKGNIEEVQQ